MPRMIPEVLGESIANRGERETYIALLEQLPKDWVVRHHFPFCWEDRSYLRDGEADFIVLAPRRGVMVLEVKGSHGYESVGGKWYRVKEDGTREITGNPFDQAMGTKHRLIHRIASTVFGCPKGDFPGIFGHLVVYPFGKVAGPIGSAVEHAIIVNSADMGSIRRRIEEAFDVWGNPARGSQFTPEVMARVVDFISDQSKVVPLISADARETNRRIDSLTRAQYSAFRGILANPRVHVRGGAGSGKTLLAAWSASSLSEGGKRVLFICYNRVLATWLTNRDGCEGVSIQSFFSLAHQTVELAGMRYRVPGDRSEMDAFYENVAPTLFAEAIETLDENRLQRFDAIVVDEAQDFHPNWWFPIQLLLKEPDSGRLCIFSDPEQAGIYGRSTGYPSPLVPYQLMENCRNSRRIGEYCGRVLGIGVEFFPTLPNGSRPQVLPAAAGVSERADLIRKSVVDLMAQGFTASQIAILSPYQRNSKESALSRLPAINSKALRGDHTDLEAWAADRIIWASSIASFKGLEADCVIIADVEAVRPGGPFSPADAYVAGSRARNHLVIAPVSSGAVSEQMGWGAGP